MARAATRSALEVRAATPEDLPMLVALHAELGEPPVLRLLRGRPSAAGSRSVDHVEQGFRAALDASDRRVVLALLGAEPAGLAVLTIAPTSPLRAEPIVRIGPLVVAKRTRRRGVGRALLAAAVAFGDERGAESATIVVRPGDREGNRYFARFGFAPLEIRRVAPLAVLRRQLGHPAVADVVRGRSSGPPPVLRRRLRTRALSPSRHAALRDEAGTR